MALTDDDKNWIATAIRDSERRVTADLSGKIEQINTNLNAKIEHTETALLTAFHQWASPVESKLRSQREAIRALDQEHELSTETARKVAELELRIRKLEKAS